jgi:hypothetical protein
VAGEEHQGQAASLAALRLFAGVGFALFAVSLLFKVHPNEAFLDASFRVPYPGFTWVRPLPVAALQLIAGILGVAAIAMAVGFRYRMAAWTVAITYGYLFLLDSVYYDNVAYFAVLGAVLLAVSPAHGVLSVDAALRRRRSEPPLLGNPGPSIALIRFQVGCVYLFAGLAKCYPDWLRGEPLRAMCPVYPPARLLAAWVPEHRVYSVASSLALVFELVIVPLLLLRRTRVWAFGALVLFHVHNGLLMPLGAVPWVMLGASTVFLPADWPRHLGLPAPALPAAVVRGRLWSAFAAAWVILQLALPLRRWITPGEPMFHGVGHDFTWAMRSRSIEAGGSFRVVDDSGKQTVAVLAPGASPETAQIVARDPFMVWWSARDLAQRRHVHVYAVVMLKLNERPASQLIDPTVDLGAESYPLVGVPSWVRRHSTE